MLQLLSPTETMIKKYKLVLGGGQFCGKGPYLPINSYSNIVQLNFISDKETEDTGFRLTWESKPIRAINKISCDFDEGICPGWRQAKDGDSDQFDWDLKSGATQTKDTGPENDHTKGDRSKYLHHNEKLRCIVAISRAPIGQSF